MPIIALVHHSLPNKQLKLYGYAIGLSVSAIWRIMMKIITTGYALPIEKALINILEKELSKIQLTEAQTVIFNFRNPSYSGTSGGYHPVEIMISPKGLIEYITDFAFVGSLDTLELAKELDFDFANGLLEQFGHCYAIENAWELFPVFVQNFCAYYNQGVFDVEVSHF